MTGWTRWRNGRIEWEPLEPSEPRPRVVPEVGSPPVGAESRLPAPVVAPQRLVVGPLGHKWMRGIGYEALRSELADGYYPDDTVNP